jgi:DMSO/TMAO reductase YedYZ molybdopterin-dependent catalytic subunit
MNDNYNTKRIAGKEKLAKYRKAMLEKRKWDNQLPQGEGPLNREGNPKTPPGQRIVTNWPVLDLGVQPTIEEEDWSLTISGLVNKPKIFTWEDFMSLPQVEDVSDFHCVTSWSRLENHWKGVRFRDIANHCEVLPTAKFV